jgi:cytidylate kinase
MIKIISVEREYGAGGSIVAAELARRKGWDLLDQQLTAEIARLASVDSQVVARCEEKVDPLMHRLAKVFWRGSHERSLPIADDKIFDADTMVQLAHRVIEDKARQGNCVIVGRGGPYILRNRNDTFRVFVFGSREKKIRRLIGMKLQPKEAEELVDAIDRERALFVRKYYNAEWPCRKLYHLMLNSDAGIDFVTDAILQAIDRLEQSPTVVAENTFANAELHSKPV